MVFGFLKRGFDDVKHTVGELPEDLQKGFQDIGDKLGDIPKEIVDETGKVAANGVDLLDYGVRKAKKDLLKGEDYIIQTAAPAAFDSLIDLIGDLPFIKIIVSYWGLFVASALGTKLFLKWYLHKNEPRIDIAQELGDLPDDIRGDIIDYGPALEMLNDVNQGQQIS